MSQEISQWEVEFSNVFEKITAPTTTDLIALTLALGKNLHYAPHYHTGEKEGFVYAEVQRYKIHEDGGKSAVEPYFMLGFTQFGVAIIRNFEDVFTPTALDLSRKSPALIYNYDDNCYVFCDEAHFLSDIEAKTLLHQLMDVEKPPEPSLKPNGAFFSMYEYMNTYPFSDDQGPWPKFANHRKRKNQHDRPKVDQFFWCYRIMESYFDADIKKAHSNEKDFRFEMTLLGTRVESFTVTHPYNGQKLLGVNIESLRQTLQKTLPHEEFNHHDSPFSVALTYSFQKGTWQTTIKYNTDDILPDQADSIDTQWRFQLADMQGELSRQCLTRFIRSKKAYVFRLTENEVPFSLGIPGNWPSGEFGYTLGFTKTEAYIMTNGFSHFMTPQETGDGTWIENIIYQCELVGRVPIEELTLSEHYHDLFKQPQFSLFHAIAMTLARSFSWEFYRKWQEQWSFSQGNPSLNGTMNLAYDEACLSRPVAEGSPIFLTNAVRAGVAENIPRASPALSDKIFPLTVNILNTAENKNMSHDDPAAFTRLLMQKDQLGKFTDGINFKTE